MRRQIMNRAFQPGWTMFAHRWLCYCVFLLAVAAECAFPFCGFAAAKVYGQFGFSKNVSKKLHYLTIWPIVESVQRFT